MCALFVLGFGGSAMAGAASPAAISAFRQLDEPNRVRALIHLAKEGEEEEAAELLSTFPLTGKFAENRTLFIQGLIERARGNLRPAVQLFRKALAADPSLTLVRAELAKTLEMMGEDDGAKHHLELLRAEAPDQQSATAITSFIDRIDAKRPYSFSGYVSVAPSTNINSGTSNDKIYLFGLPFDIDPDSKKTSGIGLSAGLSGAYTKHLAEDLVAVVAAGVDATVYRDSDFNQFTASESLDLRHLYDHGYVGLGIVGSQTLGDASMNLGYWSVGPRASLSHQLGLRDTIRASTTLELRTYPHNESSDGYAILNDVTLSHAFDSGFVGYLSAGIDRVKTNEDHLDYWSYSAGLGVYKELPAGLTVNSQIEFRESQYDGIFPLMDKAREDQRLTASISLTKRDFDILGYAPVIEYSYTLNNSNVSFYEYDAHTIDFRLTKEF